MLTRGRICSSLILWIASAVCLSMSSCTLVWSDDETPAQCKVQQTVTLNLTITHPDASIHTRADLEYDDLEFTKNEAAVRSLTAFIVDLNSDGTENYDKVECHSTEIDPIEFRNGIYALRQSVTVETGAKHVYVGANMKKEHIDAFIENRPLQLAADAEGPAVNMVMTPDPTHSGQGTDIVMFGQLADRYDQSATRIDIQEGKTDYYLHADLTRLTAKVLLTCTEGETGLVVTGGKGWVETDKIRYTLNSTNRSTYINRRADNEDPNWGFGSWVALSDGKYGPAGDHTANFEYWDPETITERLFDDRYSATPLVYDASRVGEGNRENHYTEGLYCLENTVLKDMDLSGSALHEAARIATTHVVMAVRFIPKKFVGGWGTVEPLTLDDALNINLVSGGGSGPHEGGTYFTRIVDGVLTYYAYTGMQKTIEYSNGTLSESDFTCYEGGWSYFTTFIDGNATDLTMNYDGLDSWGVQRDHYYILSIDKITRPGSPIPWDDYIRVNSQTTEWTPRGSQNVDIKPKGE